MNELLKSLGISEVNHAAHDGAEWIETPGGDELVSYNPTTGEKLATIVQANEETYEKLMERAQAGFAKWRSMPAPARGEVVRQMGNALREHKEALGKLVSLEMGKIATEGEGEVQEMIDIADFAVGLSRQLYGLTMQSERPGHRMYEQWHPLGVIGIVTAFNFPVAVWAWNSMLAGVCGDAMIWKPSSKTPLCAIATQKIIEPVVKEHGIEGVFSMIIGRGSAIGEKLISDRRVPLISATGSCRMGRRIGEVVAKRLARTLLELGGNNGIIVMDDADPELVLRAVLFGAVGTAGQRCTSTRRLFIHEKVHDQIVERLVKAYGSVTIGDPLDPSTLMGPLIDDGAVKDYQDALAQVTEEGGEILCGGSPVEGPGSFVQPTIVKAHRDMKIVREETFAPILYIFQVSSFEEALEIHNSVDQGLSSAVFTNNLLTAERWLSPAGSDCGIANVNIGTSGAEIGGAFGGEKDTGGGREAGSDSWKVYMRRQTVTINYTDDLPLAQGVSFDID
ncbi:MAG: aldehyde dehydrogenase family protein [Planctomycetota bacterium]|nr:aldehyde dehydrogenase family protein [Planctomycetota bacterium]